MAAPPANGGTGGGASELESIQVERSVHFNEGASADPSETDDDRQRQEVGIAGMFGLRVAQLLERLADELNDEHRRALQECEDRFQFQAIDLKGDGFKDCIEHENQDKSGVDFPVPLERNPGIISTTNILKQDISTSSLLAVSPGHSNAEGPHTHFVDRSIRKLHFRLLDTWDLHQDEVEYNETNMEHDVAQMQYYAGLVSRLTKGMDVISAQRVVIKPSKWILMPHSRARVMWDVLAATVLAYDMVTIPMGVFDMQRKGFLQIMSLIIMMYWTIDIVANFFVGYYQEDGEVELRASRVASRYFRTWLLPDLGIVSVDWLTTGVDLVFSADKLLDVESAGLVRIGKFMRFIRMLRVVRLMRIGKLRLITARIQDLIGMESTEIVFGLCKNLTVILFINHILACCWFWIGERTSAGWTTVAVISDHWVDGYLMSLHWSIANFTPGSSGVQPRSTVEYGFAVVVLFFALVVFSVFVSSTTSLISRLMGLQNSKSAQVWVLKGFLAQNKFPADFRDRVMRYVKAALGARRHVIHKESVELLHLLSQPLLEEVNLGLHLATLRAHNFFKLLSYANPLLVRKITVEVLKETSFSRGDIIFTAGEATDVMAFVESGILSYNSMILQSKKDAHRAKDGTNSGRMEKSEELDKCILLGTEDFFCEAVLWTKWHCRGVMQADADCRLLELTGMAFRKTVRRHALISGLIHQYARAFVEVLNLAAAGNFSGPLTDLQASFLMEGDPILRVLAEPISLSTKSSSVMNSSPGALWNSLVSASMR